MWELYDKLIEQVDDHLIIEEVVAGLTWTACRSKSLGLAMSPPPSLEPSPIPGTCQGKTAKELAGYVKSWDLMEAAMGLSAINSTINTTEHLHTLKQNGVQQLSSSNVFDLLAEEIIGKKVAIIGHFPNVSEIKDKCQLTVIERKPQIGDLLDSASEYLLPEQDIVIITSSTLINKTTPRLLQLCDQALTVMVGPSTPLSPVLFDMGVDILGGLIVEDQEATMRCIKEGGELSAFKKHAQFVNLTRTQQK